MRALSELEDEELASLSESDFSATLQAEARLSVPEALETISSVMSDSEDDNAKLKAADKILSLAGVKEKPQAMLPNGLTPELFAIALAGLGQLAGIANTSHVSDSILINVTPAKTDPRLIPHIEVLEQLSSTVEHSSLEEDDNSLVVEMFAKERYEIKERQSN
jgi:hypothetical protein